jgi:hypothetical protein
MVAGLISTQCWSQDGILSVGTNALLVKVSGKITMKPKIGTCPAR